MSTNNEPIIGIDLGTTNSVLAILEDGVPRLIPVQGADLLPSVVGIDPQGEVLVGETARNQWVAAPERTVRSIKRHMGSAERVSMAGVQYSPQEISAFILREIVAAATEATGQPVTRAVITVPAYFNEVQRQATMEAGQIAGLEVERIINEPTAAALAYGYGVGITDEHLRMLVFDLGGGTFDVSVIELNYGVVDVIATGGDNRLGGDDFDAALAGMIADEFEEEHDIALFSDHQAWARLMRVSEEAKIELSSRPYANVNLEFIASDNQGLPLHITREVERSEFDELLVPFLDRIRICMDQALADAKLEAAQIDRVLLVGGSTRIPAVVDLVRQRMQQDPHMELDPDDAVALGAAVQAGIVTGQEIDAILVDVTPLSLGIETAEFGRDGRVVSDRYARLIHRNSTVPIRKSEVFTTMYPGQDTIHVFVYQGEDPIASQNVLLGDFRVEDLKPNQLGGLAEVEINFALDLNGILNVTVTDRATGKQVSERLKAERQRMTPEEIAQSQEKLSSLVASAVEAELDPEIAALLARAEQVLAEQADELDDELIADIRQTVAEIRQAAAAGDMDSVEDQSEELVDLLMEAEL